MGHAWGFTLGTALGEPVLFHLTPVRTLTGMSIHHDVRQDEVERHDRQTTPAHGASDGQDHDVAPPLLTSIGSAGPT